MLPQFLRSKPSRPSTTTEPCCTESGKSLGMRRQQNDLGAADEVLHARLRLFLEVGVAGADAFVDQQDVRRLHGRQCESQPHLHAGRIDPRRQRQILAEFGELLDVTDVLCHPRPRPVVNIGREFDILVSGRIIVQRHALLSRANTLPPTQSCRSSGDRCRRQDATAWSCPLRCGRSSSRDLPQTDQGRDSSGRASSARCPSG